MCVRILAACLLMLGMLGAPAAWAAGEPEPRSEPPSEPWWTANKFHRYTGLGPSCWGRRR